MECNCDWKNIGRNDKSVKQQELYHNSNALYQIINQKSNMEIPMKKSKMKISMTRNTSLIPFLLCIVLVFFMIITVLLIMVIFLSTQRTTTTTTGRWNSPFNNTFTYANRIRQNLDEVNRFFYSFFFYPLIK